MENSLLCHHHNTCQETNGKYKIYLPTSTCQRCYVPFFIIGGVAGEAKTSEEEGKETPAIRTARLTRVTPTNEI